MMRTIELTDLTNIEGMSPRLSLQSMDISTVTLAIPQENFDNPDPFEKYETVRITLGGRTVMVGSVTSLEDQGGGDARYWQIQVSDYWYNMMHTPSYQAGGNWGTSTPPSYPKPNGLHPYSPASRQLGQMYYRPNTMQGATKAPIGPVLESVLSEAAQDRFDTKVLLSNDSEMVPWSVSLINYGPLLQRFLTWRPRMASRWDYSQVDAAYASGDQELIAQARPRLILADPQQEQPHVIGFDTHHIKSWALKPRWDQVPPSVGIIMSTKSYQGQPVWTTTVAPQGASLNQLHSIVAQFSESATGAYASALDPEDPPEDEEDLEEIWREQQLSWDTPEILTKGELLPRNETEFIEWLKKKIPELEGKNIIARGLKKDVAPTMGAEGNGYSASAIQYELLEGEIGNRTTGVKWCEVRCYAQVLLQGKPSADLERYFPCVYNDGVGHWGVLGAQVITTNKRRYSYRPGPEIEEDLSDEPEDEEEDDPAEEPDAVSPYLSTEYQSVVDGLYADTRPLPYEGSVDVSGLEDIPDCGRCLQITGGKPAWATMTDTVIQQMDVDIEAGTVSLTVGPPSHLKLTEPKNMQQDFQDMSDDTSDEDDEDKEGAGGNAGWSTQADYIKRKRPILPGVGPKSQIIMGAFSPYGDHDFALRVLYNIDGSVIKAQVKQGEVIVKSRGYHITAGDQEWTDMPASGPVYCNVLVDKYGQFVSASFASTPIENDPYKIRMPLDGQPAPEQLPGSYAFLIGTMMGNERPVPKIHEPIDIYYEVDTFIVEGPAE